MKMNISDTEYVSKQDKSYTRSYEKILAGPSAKARLKGESWTYFEDFLRLKKPATRYVYSRLFLAFLEWLDYDTEQLYKEYLIMTRSEDPRKVKRMKMKVSRFQDHYAETMEITDSQASNIYNAVKGFFKANYLVFEFYGRGKYQPREITNISKEQILKVLNVTGSPKVKSGITFAKDTGLRISDLVAIPIRKIRKVLDDPTIEYYTFEWKTIKTGEMANPVIGPDAINSLRKWMDYRVNIQDITANDDDHIFCSERNRKESRDKNDMVLSEVIKGDILTSSCLSANFGRLVKKARLKPFPGESKLPSIQSLRKFHQTALESMHVPTNWINRMTGRKGEGTSGIYSKPPENKLIGEYQYGYPALSLTEKVQDNETQELRHRLVETEEKLAQMREIPELASIMDRLNGMQNQIDNMSRGGENRD